MRKYYHPSVAKKFATALSQGLHHWDIARAYIGAHVETFPFLADLYRFIDADDAVGFVKAADEIGNPTLLHQGSLSLSEARVRRQIAALLKKYPFTKDESRIDTRAVAMETWQQSELQCRETNRKLGWRNTALLPPWFLRARQIIAEVLGDLEPALVMKILKLGRHGPGATVSSVGNRTTTYYKFADLPYTCTPEALPYAKAAISQDPSWMEILEQSGRRKSIPWPNCPRWVRENEILDACIELVATDRVTFVPKTCLTDRPIAVGASMNIYLQLAVGTYIQQRLALFGVDLTDQSKNQKFAEYGSKFAFLNGIENRAAYATLDLSSASDTISLELVRKLLDPEWFAFLDDLRHTHGEVDGKIVSYEKFSAMGNGFTFPLESLIFYAIAKATVEYHGHQCKQQDIAIFGDDIIVRGYCAQEVAAALNWCGFTVSPEKSFFEGYFKESCGADFYRGTNVRPFYLKRRCRDERSCYFLLNACSQRLLAYSDPGLVGIFRDVLARFSKQRIRYSPISDCLEDGLQVPLSVMRQIGKSPFLSPDEVTSLRKAGFLDDAVRVGKKKAYLNLGLAYTWSVAEQPVQYRGRGYIRMYMSLRARGETQSDLYGRPSNLIREATLAGVVTRRDASTEHVRVLPVHNWNGQYTERQLSRHPACWWLI